MKRNIVTRKLTTTFLTVLLVAFYFGIQAGPEENVYNQGAGFLNWALVYSMYIGAVVLIYGNAASLLIDYLQRRYLKKFSSGIYILLHVLFGLGNGLIWAVIDNIFGLWWIGLSLAGAAAALVYALIDLFLLFLQNREKRIWPYVFAPILLYTVVWGVLELKSPAMPPFTADDAVAFATESDGTYTDKFPAQTGVQNVEEEYGARIAREIRVEPVNGEKETYYVYFVETNLEIGRVFETVYKVDRNGMVYQNTTDL